MDKDERERLIRLETRFESMEHDIKEMRSDLRAIKEQATRWKSALAVLLAIGGIAGWFIATFKGFLLK